MEFFLETIYIDYFAVFLAALLYAAIYLCWYSKWLFGPIKTAHFFLNCILGLVISYFIAFFEGYLGVTTVSDGMFVGFCLWLGFVVPTLLAPGVWDRKFFVESGVKLLTFLTISGIIGA